MTASAEIISALISGGMDPIEAAQLFARATAEMVSCASPTRSSGAIRTERWRENKRHKASQCDGQDTQAESVTNRHKASQSVTSDNTPLSSSKEDNRKRGARLSQDWSPTDADRTFAKQLGWSDPQIDSEAGNFRDYWIAKPGSGGLKLDWPATWRKWVRSSKVKPAGQIQNTTSAPDKIPIEEAVRLYAKSGNWSRYAPVSDVSQAPPELLEKYGFLADGRRAA